MPNILGVIIGGAWNNALGYEKKIRLYAGEKCGDNILFLGTREDIKDLYPDLDVAVHPSHSENVGGAAESLILAIPTIATNVGGFPDLVKHNETGWLVKKRDPVQLAGAIFEALRDPEHSRDMALKGQDLAKRLFDVRATAQQVFSIYQAIYSRQRMGN
jgi:glycosyltransferase involved in cell wall biosynthesis